MKSGTALEAQIERLKKNLVGYPGGTAEAGAEFLRTGGSDSLWALITGVLHYLAPQTTAEHLEAMRAGEAPNLHLVEELELDSLTMTEIAFLVEDSLAISLPDEALVKLATVGDLHQLLKRSVEATR